MLKIKFLDRNVVPGSTQNQERFLTRQNQEVLHSAHDCGGQEVQIVDKSGYLFLEIYSLCGYLW